MILASASPRRAELLRRARIPFEVRASAVAECAAGTLPPAELAVSNARIKAMATAALLPRRTVLGADTIVVLAGEVFGKPGDMEEAGTMLLRLAGHVHEVRTAVCIVPPATGSARCEFTEVSRVRFRGFDRHVANAYLRDVNPLDKAGAYAAQEDAGRLIEQIEGCRDNVIGLPVMRVLAALRAHFSTIVELPAAC